MLFIVTVARFEKDSWYNFMSHYLLDAFVFFTSAYITNCQDVRQVVCQAIRRRMPRLSGPQLRQLIKNMFTQSRHSSATQGMICSEDRYNKMESSPHNNKHMPRAGREILE